jgi:hypothetical protein
MVLQEQPDDARTQVSWRSRRLLLSWEENEREDRVKNKPATNQHDNIEEKCSF